MTSKLVQIIRDMCYMVLKLLQKGNESSKEKFMNSKCLHERFSYIIQCFDGIFKRASLTIKITTKFLAIGRVRANYAGSCKATP